MTTWRELRHQMRPYPPVWTRPMEDRPPWIIWPIAALLVPWPIILAVLLTSHHTMTFSYNALIWGIFYGWCIGVLGAGITHYIYRR